MALPGILQHRKFLRAVHLLGIPSAHLLGHLETMWQRCYEATDDLLGDTVDVELMCGWVGKPGELTPVLHDSGFLDYEDGVYRVHDLWENAPKYVQRRWERKQARREAGKTLSDIRAEAGRVGGLAKAGKCLPIAKQTVATTPPSSPLLSSPDLASSPVGSDEPTSEEALVGPPAGGRDARPGKSAQVAELEWRLSEVWETHKRARLRFFESRNGSLPAATPALTKEIRKAIREALREHDGERLKEEDRDEWKRASPVRAAGIGIFLSPFHRGEGKDADGTTYLEPWRPWKRQRGKPDPVEMFARFYFDERSRRGM